MYEICENQFSNCGKQNRELEVEKFLFHRFELLKTLELCIALS